MNQPILLYRSGSVYANETTAWAALDAVTHKKGQPIVAFYTLSSPVSGHHGSSTIGAIFAIGIGDGVGQYKACTSHDDMLIVAQSLNAHITQFNQMFEYDANHNAIKAKLDFYTTDGKSISAGGIGSGSSASLGALYQLIDVMANSSNTGVEGAVEGSVLAYDAKAGKWKAIAQSEILPDMSGYYTKDETDSAINTAKSNLQGQVDTLKALIPATASATNPLADKDFVNSSIATATAEFKGSFTSLDELKATSGNLNDYAFYLHTDDVGNKVVDRYKWTTAGWLYEYTLNNSSFTAEQWAALNSTITATLVQSYNSHLNNSTIHITANERNAWNNKWDYNEETIKAVKVNAAVNADKLGGYSVTTNKNTPWGTIPYISTTGIMEVGKSFEFHFDNTTGSDYSTVLTCTGNYDNIVKLPSASGTLALLTDNVASATKLQTPRTLWGKLFDGTSDVSGDLKDVGNITASGKATIQGDIISGGEVAAIVGEGTPAGVTDYSALTGKPSINGVTLVSGNNTLASLGIQAAGDYATNSGVTTLLANYADKTFVSNNYVGKSAFNSHIADTDIHITAAERNAWNAKWDYNEATIKAVKVTSASSADSVAWSGITGKPTTFTPSAHTHYSIVTEGDNRNVATTPNDYVNSFVFKGLKTNTAINGISSNLFNYLIGLRGWNNDSGGDAHELAFNNNGIFRRQGSTTEWSSWYKLIDTGNFTKSLVEGVLTGEITSHTHTFASLTSKPTTIAGYGITDALTTSNYNSYSPTLTGTGASGTWGISISGNAATVGGYSVTTNKNTPWGTIPYISTTGIMEVGKHFEFHYDNTTGSDYSTVLACTGNYGNIVSLPSASGTLALLTDNVASSTKLQTPRTIWGRSFDGSANVAGDIHLGNLSDFEIGTGHSHSDTKRYNKIVFGAGGTGLQYISGSWTGGNIISHNFKVGFNDTTALAITNNGNILIGTTTDNGYKLQVEGQFASYSYNDGWGTLGTKPTGASIFGPYAYGLMIWVNGGGNACMQVGRTDNRASAYNLVMQHLGGNVLIGTTTDNGYKLQVNGSERVYGDLIVDGEVSALVA